MMHGVADGKEFSTEKSAMRRQAKAAVMACAHREFPKQGHSFYTVFWGAQGKDSLFLQTSTCLVNGGAEFTQRRLQFLLVINHLGLAQGVTVRIWNVAPNLATTWSLRLQGRACATSHAPNLGFRV